MFRSATLFFFALIAGTVAVVLPDFWQRGGEGDGHADIRMAVWGMPFEDRLFEDIYARGHEDLNPLVTVDYQRHADLYQKYNAWHANGEGAEVMRLGIDYYDQFVERGILAPLDDYMALPAPYGLSDSDLAAFPPGLLDILRIDGKLYGLPQDTSQYGLYYNKEIFDAYNAEHPDDPLSYPSPDWTWDELRDAAAKLTRRSGSGEVEVAGLDMAVWVWVFFNFFGQAGGEMWDDGGATTLVNSPAGVEALEFLRTLIVEDQSWKPSFGVDQGSGPTALFAAGKTAMMFGGSWWVPFFDQASPDLDYAVSALPRGRVPAVPCGMVVWCMSTNARHPTEGWRMLRWLVEEEQAAAYWDTLRVAPPANIAVLASPGFQETAGIAKRDDAGLPIPGQWEVTPLRREDYADRAAWLTHAWQPHPQTGEPPAYVITGRYQQQLQAELQVALETFLADPADADPQELLDRVARRTHEQIDRERSARGLPGVDRE
ncbi:sugar ABC transporter substrate-binding protein [Phycisphaeraceae bacterium D3-23]